MEVGIVGLPYAGKTTLFRALTLGAVETGGGAARANVGVAQIPDPRLALIAGYIPTKKITPATIKLVDIPGLARGTATGQAAQFLAQIREVDAIVHVVRCFESADVPHVDGTLDPVRDIETVELELVLADHQVVETALPKAERSARARTPEGVARLALLQRLAPVLAEGRPARAVKVTDPEEVKCYRGLALLTGKPVLFVANVSEQDATKPDGGALGARVRAHADAHGAGFVALCAKIEAELAELQEPDRSEMLASLGLKEPALAALARAAYRLLGLQSFYTAGEKEVRAWPVPVGATAPQAAGVIHSDFERGFIRVEVYSVDDLDRHKSEKAIKEAGRMRTEGKNYVMRDADVCHFLFNV